MTKAFLYDSFCGLVYRCMFAGIDDCGHAQWVNITPGEQPRTLRDYVIDEDLEDTRFYVLAMDGETVQSSLIAEVLGKVAEEPFNKLSFDLDLAVQKMKRMGIQWNQEPLELEIRVFENSVKSQRSGKYSFWVKDKKDTFSILTDVDGFDDLKDVFEWIRTYLQSIEMIAKIPVITKELRISEKLIREVKKDDLAIFNCQVTIDNIK